MLYRICILSHTVRPTLQTNYEISSTGRFCPDLICLMSTGSVICTQLIWSIGLVDATEAVGLTVGAAEVVVASGGVGRTLRGLGVGDGDEAVSARVE